MRILTFCSHRVCRYNINQIHTHRAGMDWLNQIIFGCVADDFTGGSDAASFLTLSGMRTILYNGIPDAGFTVPDGCEAVVIALKSRTQKTRCAVRDSLDAIRLVLKSGNFGQEDFFVRALALTGQE